MPYFDHNATVPLSPSARDTWLRVQDEQWHNPSGLYRAGARASLRLDVSRERLAEWLGASPGRVVFNSGATEGAHAIASHWAGSLPQGKSVAVSPTEHPCVLAALEKHLKGRYQMLALDAFGRVDLEKLRVLLASGSVAGVVAMAANNETGVLNPWIQIAALCRDAQVEYFCDASQWLGKITAAGLGKAAWVIGSGHKWGAPKGVGFVLRPESANGFSFLTGGAQEKNQRSGTEDVAGIVAMVAALSDAEQSQVAFESARELLRTSFESRLRLALPGVQVIGEGAERLWNTVQVVMPHTENHRWVLKLDKRDVQVSTGSACAAGKDQPSHVLAALGIEPARVRRSLRFSAGWSTTADDWTALLTGLQEVSAELGGSTQPGPAS